MSYRLSEDMVVYPIGFAEATAGASEPDTAVEPFNNDIGGLYAATPWVLMRDYKRVYAFVVLGTFTAADQLDVCKLQQATDSDGLALKDLTSSGSGDAYDYDTDDDMDGAGDTVILEARAEDLDTDGGFTYVRLLIQEAGNTGPDFVAGFLALHGAAYQKAKKQGASSATKRYVTPTSAVDG